MILSDSNNISNGFLQQTWLAYKNNTKFPALTDDKGKKLLMVANIKQSEWARDPNNPWSSLYEKRDIGTAATGTLEYELEDDFLSPAEFVTLTKDGKTMSVKLVSPQQRSLYPEGAFIAGRDPRVLHFISDIPSAWDGATISLAAYWIPDALSNAGDAISVDDPSWLVLATAAELSRGDLSRQDQFGNLVGMANERYEMMVDANTFSGYLQGSAAAVSQQTIGME